MRILFAEDHADLRGVMKALLELHGGWQVCGEAVNGIEAVEKAAELKPDLIIMDLSMPKMDGLQASKLISAVAPQIPILLHTNYSLAPETISEARKAGVWEVLTKGRPDQLLKAIEALHLLACAKQEEQAVKEDDAEPISSGEFETEPA
jgi:DNA-binding NarL/FixJ family response regulator